MERYPLSARNGWLAIGALALAYEIAAPKGELLSEGVDRAMDKYPIAARLPIIITALHLLNLLPERLDPYHQGLKFVRGHQESDTL